ncbi:hypothetical protein [Streptomyces phaeochromogenes]|uniref:hypothetical protein n=1 Tax=Streptomyces phaeochromogenes TaxID=1923 RepID=UPI0036B96DAE
MSPDSTTPAPRESDPILSAGLEIARRWGQVSDADQLKVALNALEPELQREHEFRMKQLEQTGARDKRAHRLKMTSLIVGALVSIGMLTGGVYVAKDAWWLATLLCGPSLISMAVIIILRRHDAKAAKVVADAARRSNNAAAQANQQPPVV